MTTRQSQSMALVARCRKVGWDVERADDGYAVTTPAGRKLLIHLTYSDVKSVTNMEKQLIRAGLDKAEAIVAEAEAKARQQKLAEDQAANQRKLVVAASRSKAITKAAGPYGAAEVTLAEILRKHKAPITWTRVLVTPEMATAMLERNTDNRKSNHGDIDVLVSDLRTNNWRYIHTGVAFDWNGVLQDGQQRLIAIERAGIAAEVMISAGMDPANFPVIDTGRKRTAAQALTRAGATVNPTLGAATLRLIWLFQLFREGMLAQRKDRLRNQGVVDLYSRCEQDLLGEAVRLAYRLRVSTTVSPTGPAAAFYVLLTLPDESGKSTATEAHQAEVYRYAEDLIAGSDGPTKVANRYLLLAGKGNHKKIDATTAMAIVMKGWNAWLTGDTPKTFAIQPGAKVPPPLAHTASREQAA